MQRLTGTIWCSIFANLDDVPKRKTGKKIGMGVSDLSGDSICLNNLYIHTRVGMYMYMYIGMHMYMYMCMYACMYACINI